jgi:hypothetical protein
MAKNVLIDEFHVSFLAPHNLSPGEYDGVRQTLDEPYFRALLKRAVKNVTARFPSLNKVRVRLSR